MEGVGQGMAAKYPAAKRARSIGEQPGRPKAVTPNENYFTLLVTKAQLIKLRICHKGIKAAEA